LKQLERGLVTDVERKSDPPTTTMQNFLLRYNKNKTKSITLWTNFVDQNFDRIVYQERAKLQEELGSFISSSFLETQRLFTLSV
jgi:hypothetical protein